MRAALSSRMKLSLAVVALVSVCAAAQAFVAGPQAAGVAVGQVTAGPGADTTPIPVQARGGRLTSEAVSAGGLDRTYLLHVPSRRDRGSPAPLVIAFHGGGGEAAGFAARTGLVQMADREGFLIAFPEGIRGSWNTQGRPAVGYASRRGVDDVAFARALIRKVSAEQDVDASRIFAVGLSAGGMMAYTLACDMPDQIAAIAVVAATLADESCSGLAGVSLLHIHGSDDQNVPMRGGAGAMSAARASYPPVMEGISLFERRNRCSASGSVSRPASDTVCSTSACDGGDQVAFCEVTPGGHAWPGIEPAGWQVKNNVYVSPNFDATAQIAAFLRNR